MQAPARLDTEAVDAAQTRVFRCGSSGLQHPLPLLGRDPILTSIRRALQAAFSSSTPAAVELYGAAGSGRTRLLMAASEVAAQGWLNTRILYAACRPEADGPYGPYARILLERFGVSPASSPSRVRADMAAEVARVMDAATSTKLLEVTQLLGHIAGVPFPNSPYALRSETAPAAMKNAARDAFCEFLRQESQQRPVLLLLDDVPAEAHDTLSLLPQLMAEPSALLVIVARTATEASVADGVSEALAIEPLCADAIMELTHALLPGLEVAPKAFYEALHARTEGSPRALRELLNTMREVGAVRVDSGGPQLNLDRLPRAVLPLEEAATLRAQLSGLGESERAVLELAATAGEVFWPDALYTLAHASHATAASERLSPPPEQPFLDSERLHGCLDRSTIEFDIQDALRRLERQGIVSPQDLQNESPKMVAYRFCDPTLKHALYGHIPATRQRELHSVLAAWLGGVIATQPAEHLLEVLALHQRRAGLRQRAGHTYLRAAKHARHAGRMTTALLMVRNALPLLPEDDQRTLTHARMQESTTLYHLGELSAAYEGLSQVCEGAFAIGARDLAGRALRHAGRVKLRTCDLHSAYYLLRHARSLGSATHDLQGLGAANLELARLHSLRGEHEAALTAAQDALRIHIQRESRRGQIDALATLGLIELKRGALGMAVARLDAADSKRADCPDVEHTTAMANIALGRVQLALLDRRAEDALALLTKPLAVAEQAGCHLLVHDLLGAQAEALLAQGDLRGAKEAAVRGYASATALGDAFGALKLQRLRGLLALQTGAYTEAQALLQEGLHLAEAWGCIEEVALSHRDLARCSAHSDGPLAEANAHYQQAADQFARYGAVHEGALTEYEYASHLRTHDEPDAARHILDHARPVLQQLCLPPPDAPKAAPSTAPQPVSPIAEGPASQVASTAPPQPARPAAAGDALPMMAAQAYR